MYGAPQRAVCNVQDISSGYLSVRVFFEAV